MQHTRFNSRPVTISVPSRVVVHDEVSDMPDELDVSKAPSPSFCESTIICADSDGSGAVDRSTSLTDSATLSGIGLTAILQERNIAWPHVAAKKSVELTTAISRIEAHDSRPTLSLFKRPPQLAVLISLGIIAAVLVPGYLNHPWKSQIARSIAFVVVYPALLGSLQYFAQGVLHLVLSVRPLTENSKYYSAVPTPRDPQRALPPVIIQIPIYLESLDEVIGPTVAQAAAAVQHYRAAGGSAKIFINDDGLQLMLQRGMMKEFQARMRFYKERPDLICMVARPPENRRGHFKKASNMNYCLMVASGTTKLAQENGLSPAEARKAFAAQFALSCAFIAGGDLTLEPDTIILLLDSDTRLSPDCITKVIPEFMAEDSLGYAQCTTTAFQHQRTNYFQRLIWDFTFNIYHVAIGPDVARGHIAPLVGHNAFLSWRIIDDCKQEGEHGVWWWSENHVSEDFDMAMRMMSKGYQGRYIAYAQGFEEGISLTFPEEEKKVVKFAYGAAEMLLNPFRKWLFEGPISPLFRRFWMTKSVNFWSKLKMLLYLCEYFVTASALPMVLTEALVTAICGDGYWSRTLGFARSWDVFIYITAVFTITSPIGSIAVTMRAKLKPRSSLLKEAWQYVKWTIPTAVQWTSYSYRFLLVLVRYMLSLPMMSWGSTAKEMDDDIFSDNEFAQVVVPIYSVQIMLGLFLYSVWASLSWLQNLAPYEGFGLYIVSATYFTAPFVLNPNLIRLRY